MTPTPVVNLTIDGRAVQAAAGQTILQAAAATGITIPALCHHPQLAPAGACRLCLVEIEKQKALHPACTYPVAEGLVVRTQSPRLFASRRMTLQMIFSERSHYCMFCPASGSIDTTDCELQRLAYEHGMTNWPYPPDTARSWPVDGSHPDILLDHGRCVLCRRCVRACDSLTAAHTLGVHFRGARVMIGADDDLPLGSSSCVSCGTCIQVCPTGALTDRRSAFAGLSAQSSRIKSVCAGCAAACGIEAVVRDNQVLRINGDWSDTSAGLLCRRGRFESLNGSARRMLRPMIRREGELVESEWSEALDLVCRQLHDNPAAAVASARLPSESLAAVACFLQEVLASGEVALALGEMPPLDLGRQATLADVTASDCIVVIGQDPLAEHPVVGFLIKRAFDSGANLVVVDDQHTALDAYASLVLHLEEIAAHGESPFAKLRHTYHLRMSGIKKLAAVIAPARRPVVIYSVGLSTTVYAALRSLPQKVLFLPLVRGSNTRGAQRVGLSVRPVCGHALLAMLGDDHPAAPPPPDFQFIAVHAAYPSLWTAAADVVLPARTWIEQSGHLINLEGRTRKMTALAAAPPGVRGESELLLELARRMGHEMAYDELTGAFAAPALAQSQAPAVAGAKGEVV